MTRHQTQLLLVHGHESPRADIRTALAERHRFVECTLAELPGYAWTEPLELIIDAPLANEIDMEAIRTACRKLPKPQPGIACVIETLSRPLAVRAHAIGAEGVIPRPIAAGTVSRVVASLLDKARRRAWASQFGRQAAGLSAGTEVLEQLFEFAVSGSKLTQYELYDRGDIVIDTLAETGLGHWVEAVKAHHSQTFRHSLLVTGIAVGFGQHLTMRKEDLRRLALGGLLHDVGKAVIPVPLLEKPTGLTPDEAAIVREHTLHGRDILTRQGGFAPEMIDVVTHHHEMLDGSGYPNGLSGREIKDLVRIVTISDIFAALIEQRAYKLPLPNEAAYGILGAMDGKLDMSLVEAFKPIALETNLAA
ncbi:MAG: hypothetical protein FD175_755 [Beijerinckiaceae bacterium]|nr:MAG: hypothetical protein FD175_755 [Beijerinckiaceae bacterium]